MGKESREQIPIHFREQAARRWVQRRLGKIDHEQRVTAIATTLFDLMRELHGLGESHRRLLRLGAVVHDVGRQIDDRDHPTIGAAMIFRDATLPISPRTRRQLSYLTRYHRGAVPEARYDDILQDGDGRKATRGLLALLRAADTLDNRNAAPPRIIVSLKGRKIRVTCFIEDDQPKSRRALGRRKKFLLLEEMFSCKVEVRIKSAEAVKAV